MDPNKLTIFWLEPASSFVWTMSVFLRIACLIIQFIGRKYLVSSPNTNTIASVCILFGSFVLRSRYKVEVTILVTVEDQLKAFTTIAELRAAGFLLALQHSGYEDTVVNIRAWPVQTRWRYWYLHLYRYNYKKPVGPTIDCFHVLEEVHKEPWYMVIYTSNRYWVMKTVQAIQEDGLMKQWNEVAQFIEKIYRRSFYNLRKEAERDADFIVNRKLFVGLSVQPFFVFCLKYSMANVKQKILQSPAKYAKSKFSIG